MAKTKTEEGENIYRMGDKPLQDSKSRELPNTSGNRVHFKCEYPKDFKGEKYMEDGKVYKDLHILHAEQLEKQGVGKILKTEK